MFSWAQCSSLPINWKLRHDWPVAEFLIFYLYQPKCYRSLALIQDLSEVAIWWLHWDRWSNLGEFLSICLLWPFYIDLTYLQPKREASMWSFNILHTPTTKYLIFNHKEDLSRLMDWHNREFPSESYIGYSLISWKHSYHLFWQSDLFLISPKKYWQAS